MSDYYFQMKGLDVGYNGKPIIKNIDIDINKGEIVTLIGPNGAGKSTILKSITRQLALIGGKVIFDDKDMHQMSYKELSSQMAVVLTERLKPELMTCHDVIATGRYPYTGRLGILTRHDEEKVDEAIRAVHAEEIGSRDFNAISDGQKQRVLLARAICQEPDIIVLDEPTSFLDVKHKLDLLSILRDMAKSQGITVIMSLHEIDLAEKITDKIMCVKGDSIFRYGRPEDVFSEEVIRDLYGIDNGYFDTLFGSIELPKPHGKMETMVISSGGTGIPVYRKLQREGRPFTAGVLYTNDIDYQLARLLADEVITEEPFEEMSDESIEHALDCVEKCRTVINAGVRIGTMNRKLEKVLESSEREGKLMNIDQFDAEFREREDEETEAATVNEKDREAMKKEAYKEI
jgi:iron complex transport system ATP-binding protein